MSEQESPDPFHWHEALDRTHLISVFLETSLAEHPVIRNDAELRELYTAAFQAVETLYQTIGRKTPD
ncbi:hypothetical protein [Rubinisphaera margarita]|uniref:hypothetical protein n=1 Tax=Rubinisphaera margarita TaxID=2909586 RepID=UPI001EE867A5|nr:hypothetical protein [Rubinisphaera margarita]MCG6156982.1 hypothetical protein [Rubinisphaera margarita]